jgi:hypothetical protein
MYYLRTQAATDAIKFTVDTTTLDEPTKVDDKKTKVDDQPLVDDQPKLCKTEEAAIVQEQDIQWKEQLRAMIAAAKQKEDEICVSCG